MPSSGFCVETTLVEPGVRANLVHRRPLRSVVGEKADNELFKLGREVLAVDLSEVRVVLTLLQKVVEVFLGTRLLEGENTLDDDEEDHSKGEQVDFCPFVLLSFFYFWGHVGHCSSVAFEAIDVLVAGEAKVHNFEVQLVVNEDVLEF